MDEAKLRSIAQLQAFLNATQEISFTGAPGGADQQRYEHISRVLKRFDYPQLGKAERGVVLAYIRRTSGYSRSQIIRLVGRWGGQAARCGAAGQALRQACRSLCAQVHRRRCRPAGRDGPGQ